MTQYDQAVMSAYIGATIVLIILVIISIITIKRIDKK